jgi:hypothetical protein
MNTRDTDADARARRGAGPVNSSSHEQSVYREHALRIYMAAGSYADARRRLIAQRDQSTAGTFTHAFGNAAIRELERLRETGEIS